MKHFILLAIRAYWLFIPKSKRRVCLFKESCSKYVYGRAKNEGPVAGIKALIFRMKNCNPDYTVVQINGAKVLITSAHFILNEGEFNDSI